MEKPWKGNLTDAQKFRYPHWPEGAFVYVGRFDGHPEFNTERGHTSLVVREEEPYELNGPYNIETLNSRYTIYPRAIATESNLERCSAMEATSQTRSD